MSAPVDTIPEMVERCARCGGELERGDPIDHIRHGRQKLLVHFICRGGAKRLSGLPLRPQRYGAVVKGRLLP